MMDDKTKALQCAILKLTEKESFYGGLLQELTIKYRRSLPTAALIFNRKNYTFEILINDEFFLSLTNEERIAVFHHEILHFTNKHVFRFSHENRTPEELKKSNIAADMAINQYIGGLPTDCIKVSDWKLDDGSPFPFYKNMETYYRLIKDEEQKQGANKETKGNVVENLAKYRQWDEHNWEDLDEETRKKLLEEAKKVINRTIEKTSHSYSTVPDSVKDLLEELETLTAKINYKSILKAAIKKTVSCVDRESSWKRPNKRYGFLSPGTRIGSLPILAMYGDTSGSISHTEFNEFLKIITNFLKVGVRDTMLNLWHTEVYYKKRYRLGSELAEDAIESGGTDVDCVLEDIAKKNPNLSIILTDGYFDDSDVKVSSEIIWIISRGGNDDHPMKHIGKTILLENITDG